MYLLERGPKDLVESTTWVQKYMIAHKQQLGGKRKATVQPRRVDLKKSTQSKPDLSQGRQRSLQCYQLVVPKELGRQLMSVNHDSAFSGHLKTEVRVLPSFFWPGLRQDVIRFCRSCDVCQRTVKRGIVKKVPLGSMPLTDTPFKRVAVDTVRSIPTPSEQNIGRS